MSKEASEACQRLTAEFDYNSSIQPFRRSIKTVCDHVNDYDKDAVLAMFGWQFPKRETFENTIDEFAHDWLYGEGAKERMTYSLRQMADDIEELG